MKLLPVYILVLASLTACSATSSQGSLECNKKEGVCIYIKAEEPIVGGEPVTITITVKGDKDMPDLGIALSSTGNVYLEDLNLKTWKKTEIGWKVDLKADKPHISKHKVLFPAEDGSYQLVTTAYIPGYGRITGNYFNIFISNKEGKVYYPGTKVPGSEGIGDVYTVIPGPSPTLIVESTVPSYP